MSSDDDTTGERRRGAVSSIASTVHRSFLAISGIIVVSALLSLAVAAVNLFVFQERVDTTTSVIRSTREAHEAILDSETALRAWVSTAEPTFLAPYEAARDRVDRDLAAATSGLSDLPRSEELLRHAIDFRVAFERWQETWAVPARQLFDVGAPLEGTELRRRLADGRDLFDRYRDAQTAFLEDIQTMRDDALAGQRIATMVAGAISVALAVAMLVVAQVQRRRLDRAVRGPIVGLTTTMASVSAGDLTVRPADEGPAEIRVLADGLSSMIAALERQQHTLAEREEALSTLAGRLEQILKMAKEISGTGSPRYVAEAAAGAARTLAGADRAWVWVLGDDGAGTLVHDTDIPHGEVVPPVPLAVGTGVAGQAIGEARIVHSTDGRGVRSAWPLVVGARVIGALELKVGSSLDPAAVEAVSTLAVHTASALEAARLYAANAELARIDPLTRLANRRSFTEDLEQEAGRSSRYDRPLSLVMIDLDHFKQLNDTFGHPFGDRVLQRVADAINATIRQVDTAYRLGGEELAVLARETDVDGAHQLGERLRAAISEALSVERGDPTTVTASVGVAGLHGGPSETVHLVAAADAALYEAKRDGRNRVVSAA